MSKIKAFLFFILSALVINAQETNKPNIKHIVGLDVGYGSYREIFHSSYYNKDNFDYNGELNLNYIFNCKKYLFIKAQLGIAPTNHFGLITKGFTCIGFTTNFEKALSWHIALGGGAGGTSKNYLKTDNNSSNNYSVSLGNLFLETGFYIKPLKSKNHYVGVNFSITSFTMKDNDRYYTNGLIGYVNVSYNIQLKKSHGAK